MVEEDGDNLGRLVVVVGFVLEFCRGGVDAQLAGQVGEVVDCAVEVCDGWHTGLLRWVGLGRWLPGGGHLS